MGQKIFQRNQLAAVNFGRRPKSTLETIKTRQSVEKFQNNGDLHENYNSGKQLNIENIQATRKSIDAARMAYIQKFSESKSDTIKFPIHNNISIPLSKPQVSKEKQSKTK